MDDHIPHSGHFIPGYVRMFFSKREWDMLGGFTKDLKASDYCIDGLLILRKHSIGHAMREFLYVCNGYYDIVQEVGEVLLLRHTRPRTRCVCRWLA